ncbi:hypothetical protein VTK56DRAFT_8232 [Thermocarpiscus australiensis]
MWSVQRHHWYPSLGRYVTFQDRQPTPPGFAPAVAWPRTLGRRSYCVASSFQDHARWTLSACRDSFSYHAQLQTAIYASECEKGAPSCPSPLLRGVIVGSSCKTATAEHLLIGSRFIRSPPATCLDTDIRAAEDPGSSHMPSIHQGTAKQVRLQQPISRVSSAV